MEPLIDSAKAGHIVLYWSPAIIAETSRVLLWLWLKRRGPDLSEGSKKRVSEAAHRWFEVMTAVFCAVDDRPPLESAWVESLPDAHDAPIWSAAIRAKINVVVTENLKHGPPADEHGLQGYEGVLYMHPARFTELLDMWGDFYETGREREPEAEATAEAPPPTTSGDVEASLEDVPVAFQEFLRSGRW